MKSQNRLESVLLLLLTINVCFSLTRSFILHRKNSVMVSYFFFLILLLLDNCSSSHKIPEAPQMEDTSYEIKFSPCVCKRQDMVLQAKKTILIQGVKDYEEFTAKKIEPELESEIIEKEYDRFLYDFSLENKPYHYEPNEKEFIKAEGKVNQKELDNFVEKKSKPNHRKPASASSDYGSKGLEVIKGFQSDRKKRQTVNEISKSRSIDLFEVKRK